MTYDKDCIHFGGTARTPKDVRRLYELGLEFAEIPITDHKGFLELVPLYQDLRDKLGLYYLCHGPREGDPNDARALERTYLPKVLGILPLMTKLEMPLLTVHMWLDSRFVKQEIIHFKIGLMKRIIDRATEAGIMISLENLSESASNLKTAFRELPSLNLTLDIGHAQLLTETNKSYELIEQYPEKIKHIHLHDNRGGDSYMDDLHLPPGEGIIDFKGIFGKLKEMDYKRTISLELRPFEIEKCLRNIKDLFFHHQRMPYVNETGQGQGDQ